MDGPELVPAVVIGAVMGTVGRLSMLRIDYRQYPSYPQGYTVHLSLGFVAALLGAIVVPAIALGDYAAASFLALAATQFREVRALERKTLSQMESDELVPRGNAYIEGIARVFEARNYLAMLTALVASLAGVLAIGAGGGWGWSLAAGGAAGGATIGLLRHAMRGPTVGDIARVSVGDITFQGPLLTVKGVVIRNVGLEEARRRYEREALALLIEPRDVAAREILGNLGQRQAIAHEVASRVGIEWDVDEPEFVPVARRDSETGTMVMAFIPTLRDVAAVVEAVKAVPLLEAVVRRPRASGKG